jgi:Holin of 3TMs, for gene-transfer release
MEDDNENGAEVTEDAGIPGSSAFGLVLPKPNASEELQLIAKNDEHEDSMKCDEGFMAQVQERNEQANQLMNLNNAALTQAGNNAAQNADVLVKNDNEDFINKKWRPMMAWLYMTVCAFDFVVFPILWSVLQMVSKGSVTTPWQPITLQGAGLFHIAMGAVLGIATYGRTKEKIEGVSNASTAVPGVPAGIPGLPGK